MRNFTLRSTFVVVVMAMMIGVTIADEPIVKQDPKSEAELRSDAESQSRNGQIDSLIKTCADLVRLVESRNSPEQNCEIDDFVVRQMIKANQLDEAESHAKRSLELSQSCFGTEHWQTVSRRWSLDYVQKLRAAPEETVRQMLEIEARFSNLFDAKKYEDAANAIEELAPLERTILGAQHPLSAYTWSNQANSWICAENFLSAESSATKALSILENKLGKRHPDTAMAAVYLSHALINQQKHSEALEYLELASTVSRDNGKHLDAALLDTRRADSLAALDLVDEAICAYETSATQLTSLGQHAHAGYSHSKVAFLLEKQNNSFEAAEKLRVAASEHKSAGTDVEPFTCLLRSAELYTKSGRYGDAVKAINDSSRHAVPAVRSLSDQEIFVELKSLSTEILPILENENYVKNGLQAWSSLTASIALEKPLAGARADRLLSLNLKQSTNAKIFAAQGQWRTNVIRSCRDHSIGNAFLVQSDYALQLNLGREANLSSTADCRRAYEELVHISGNNLPEELQSVRADSILLLALIAEEEKKGSGLDILQQHNDYLLKHLKGLSFSHMFRHRAKWLINAKRMAEGVADLISASVALESAKDVTLVEQESFLASLVLMAEEANGQLPIDAAEVDLRRKLIKKLEVMDERAFQLSETLTLWQRLHDGGKKEDADAVLADLFSLVRIMNEKYTSDTDLCVAVESFITIAFDLENSGYLGPANLIREMALELTQKMPESQALGFRVEILGNQLSRAMTGDQRTKVDEIAAKLRSLQAPFMRQVSTLVDELAIFEDGTTQKEKVTRIAVMMSYADSGQFLLSKPVIDDISEAIEIAAELDKLLEKNAILLNEQSNAEELAYLIGKSRVFIWDSVQQRLGAGPPEDLPNERREFVSSMKSRAIGVIEPSDPILGVWDSVTKGRELWTKREMLSVDEYRGAINSFVDNWSRRTDLLPRTAIAFLMNDAMNDAMDEKNFESAIRKSEKAAGMLEQQVARTGGTPQQIIARSLELRNGVDPYSLGLLASVLNKDPTTAFEFAAKGRSLGSRISWQLTRDLSDLQHPIPLPPWLAPGQQLSLEDQYSVVTSIRLEQQGRATKSIGDEVASALKLDERYVLFSTLQGAIAGENHRSSADVGLFIIRPKAHSKPGIQFFEKGEGSAVVAQSVPTEGVYVINVVNDSAAFQIGIMPGDVIRKVNGIDVTADNFVMELQKISSQPKVSFQVHRNGGVIELIRHEPAKSFGVQFFKGPPRVFERSSRETNSPELAKARTFQVSALSNQGWSTRSSRSAKLKEKDDNNLLSARGESWRLFRSLFPEEVWEELKSVRRVYISVPGQLAGLPLETLVVEPPSGKASEKETVRWIDVGPEIVYLPFASLAPRNQQSDTQPAKLDFVGIGDVDFTTIEGVKLEKLPNTRREVEGISKAHNRDSAKVLLGPDASEIEFYNNAPDGRVLSVASHGQSKDGLDTLESCIVLGASRARGIDEFPNRRDGKLTLRDLLTDWRGRLQSTEVVILSACQTGGGLVTQEDGSLGLPFGFLAAGANSVIASQWPVDDKRTADLFVEMFTNRAADEDMLTAFTRARKKLRAEHPDPYYWAPFIYISSH